MMFIIEKALFVQGFLYYKHIFLKHWFIENHRSTCKP